MEHHLHQYLAEEIAEDHAAGKFSRREALRRLAFMGFSVVTASALLAACGNDDEGNQSQPAPSASDSTPTSGGPSTTRAATTPVTTQDITYPAKDAVTLQGVYAKANSPKGAVLVIHENMGISPFIRSFTGRIAGDGYTAIAVDLLSAEGGTAAFSDPATIGPALTRLASERSVDDMKATLDELGKREPSAKLGVTGFCFGGGMVWELLKGKEARLAAAVPCYGTVANPDFTGSKAAVLGIYAQNDQRVNATREAAKAALGKAGLTHDLREYPGVGHAFIRFIDDPTNPANAQAQAAYGDMLDWFSRYLR
jgi:carboxymethylenebutenolidase